MLVHLEDNKLAKVHALPMYATLDGMSFAGQNVLGGCNSIGQQLLPA